MKRFELFLDRLNHNDRPSEAQSPIQASAVAALVSFIFICCLDGRLVSSLGIWWVELLAYAFVPVLLAFIILYRSSWHREFTAAVRTLLAGLLSCIIFVGVVAAIAAAMVLITLVWIAHFDNISRFHY